MSAWEVIAVLLGITYLLLAVRESLWCWYAAFFSTAIFLYLFWDVNLLMESALQVYYLAMAVYGWWQWRGGGSNSQGAAVELPITRWPLRNHILAIGGVVLASLLSAALLAQYTQAALPLLDSFTTWGSILTTWMVTRKILENWLYWLVIDSASIYLYLDRGLYLTAVLFVAYLVIVIFGYRKWLQHYRETSG
ncbi:MAG: nicotinamide mononucleotide transporter [Proteobacteria bacterium]|nr:nicotinamide mononucleotide transporter [Pseudomonadota bacterium]